MTFWLYDDVIQVLLQSEKNIFLRFIISVQTQDHQKLFFTVEKP